MSLPAIDAEREHDKQTIIVATVRYASIFWRGKMYENNKPLELGNKTASGNFQLLPEESRYDREEPEGRSEIQIHK